LTDHVDMSQFIAARSDQMNADDLLDAPRTITVTKVSATPDSAEQPVSIHYEGDNGKPFKPCKTVRRIMVGIWGKDASQYVGRSMTLYRDPTVAFGGMQVGGIRVSHMSHMGGEKTVTLMVTRGRKAPFKVLPLTTRVQPADDQAVALKAITDAAEEGLDALSNAWRQKWMAPHRDALQVDLDRLKVVAAANEKPPSGSTAEIVDAETGEIAEIPEAGADNAEAMQDDHPGKAITDRIIAEINAPETNAVMDVAGILTRSTVDISAMRDEDRVRVEIAADKRRAEIRAEQAKAKGEVVE
jgi:hypothetical protein